MDPINLADINLATIDLASVNLGSIDLGGSGVGDRHIDIFWGVWTLFFNLKTNAYYDRFLDAYGTDRINRDILNSIGAFEVFC